MGDTVFTRTIHDGSRNLVVQMLCKSDGTGESNVKKVDISSFTGTNGEALTGVTVKTIQYNVKGGLVTLSFDATTDQVIARLSGSGFKDYAPEGGVTGTQSAAGWVGDILLTSDDMAADDGYDITLEMIKRF